MLTEHERTICNRIVDGQVYARTHTLTLAQREQVMKKMQHNAKMLTEICNSKPNPTLAMGECLKYIGEATEKRMNK